MEMSGKLLVCFLVGLGFFLPALYPNYLSLKQNILEIYDEIIVCQ